MELPYIICDPTGNITALVTAPVPRSSQAAAAAALMRAVPSVEQVGFLEVPAAPEARVRLQMMGGEFCGNASMSAAAFLAGRDGLAAGESAGLPLEVSGAEGLVVCRIENTGETFRGTVSMPLPEAVETAVLPLADGGALRVPTVRFPGIVHCVVPAAAMTRAAAEAVVRPVFAELCASLRTEACGVLLYDEAGGSFTPLVYVAGTGTAVWESGCGSGTAAIGAWEAWRSPPSHAGRTLVLRQPGGTMEVRCAMENGRFRSLRITGNVRIAGEGLLNW